MYMRTLQREVALQWLRVGLAQRQARLQHLAAAQVGGAYDSVTHYAAYRG